MKLKTQSILLISGIALLPVLVVLISLVFQGIEEERGKNDYQMMKASYEEALAKQDWKNFRMIHPPNGKIPELAIIDPARKVVYSTIPGIATGDNFGEVYWQVVQNDREHHDYNLARPPIENADGYLWCFRFPRRNYHEPMLLRLEISIGVAAMAGILIFAAIMAIIMINSITKSVLALDAATRKVAAGELDDPIVVEGNDEICSLALSLNKMREEIKANNDRRARFIMGISHDLKTPLALIKGYTEAIGIGLEKTPEEQYEHLAIITDKTDQLEGMIDDLIDFVAVDEGAWRGNFAPVGLCPWLASFIKRSEADAELLGKTVSGRIELEPDTVVSMDERLAERALDNLVHNALRYTGDGGSVMIHAFAQLDALVIEVADNGPGIAKEDLPYVFDLFYRGTASRREQGMGIGLAIVKSVVEMHGWTVDATSQEGGGSVFRIRIPTE